MPVISDVTPTHPPETARSGGYSTGYGTSSNIVAETGKYADILQSLTTVDDAMAEQLYQIAVATEAMCRTSYRLPQTVPQVMELTEAVKRNMPEFRTVTAHAASQIRAFADESTSIGDGGAFLVWNSADAEQVRFECEKDLQRQAGYMQDTVRSHQIEVRNQDEMARIEQHISETATKTVWFSDAYNSWTEEVPDWVERERARRFAESHRQYSSGLNAHAGRLEAAIVQLEADERATGARFRAMQEQAWAYDRTYYGQLSAVADDINAHIAYANGLRDSFSTSFFGSSGFLQSLNSLSPEKLDQVSSHISRLLRQLRHTNDPAIAEQIANIFLQLEMAASLNGTIITLPPIPVPGPRGTLVYTYTFGGTLRVHTPEAQAQFRTALSHQIMGTTSISMSAPMGPFGGDLVAGVNGVGLSAPGVSVTANPVSHFPIIPFPVPLPSVTVTTSANTGNFGISSSVQITVIPNPQQPPPPPVKQPVPQQIPIRYAPPMNPVTVWEEWVQEDTWLRDWPTPEPLVTPGQLATGVVVVGTVYLLIKSGGALYPFLRPVLEAAMR